MFGLNDAANAQSFPIFLSEAMPFFLMLNNLLFDTGNENSMFAICLIVV